MRSAGDLPETQQLELSSALRIPLMRIGRRLRAQRSDLTITMTQMAALSTLERHGPLTPTALADHEHVQPPSITRVIAALESRALVARQPHATDRRQYVIALTERGQAMLDEDRRRRDAWLEQQLSALTDVEVEALKAAIPVLERLSQA